MSDETLARLLRVLGKHLMAAADELTAPVEDDEPDEEDADEMAQAIAARRKRLRAEK